MIAGTALSALLAVTAVIGGIRLARWDERRMWRNATREANACMRRIDPDWVDRP